MSTITSLSQPRRWRALPPHLHLPKRVPTITTLAHPAPAAAAALPCVFSTNSATPMACAASAPSSLQARGANHHDASSSDTRCRRSFILCVHHHVAHAENMRCLRTITSPSACQPPRRYPIRHPRLLQLPFPSSPTRQPRRWRALPPHLHISKRVRPDSALTHLVLAAAVASSCVSTNTSATPMACPASAPPPL